MHDEYATFSFAGDEKYSIIRKKEKAYETTKGLVYRH